MKRITKESALKVITSACINYDKHLKDQNFLVLYKDRNGIFESVEIEFTQNNYLHLCGIKTSLSPSRFYKKCIDGRLSVQEFDFKPGGTSHQKLSVLPFLHKLLYAPCKVGLHNSGNCIMLQSDYFIGNKHTSLNLGFGLNDPFDYPKTLCSGQIEEFVLNPVDVAAIYFKQKNLCHYTKTSFISSKFNINELPLCLQNKIRLSSNIE